MRQILIDLVNNKIPDAERAAKIARDSLQPALSGLGKWVKDAFGLTVDDFVNCVFNLAFVGDLSANKVGQKLNPHGAFSAFSTITSQSATLINKAINTLPDDEGQPVNRQRLLLRVDMISKRINSLNEAWTTIQSSKNPTDPKMIKLSDPDSYRLLVIQKDFDDMLERFSTFREVQAAKTKMDTYVSAIQTRNEYLLNYNTLVLDYLRAAGEIRTMQAHIATVEKLKISTEQPDLMRQAAFITALYNRSRERCIKYCYLASRSYRFWTLEPDQALLTSLKIGTPNEITYNLLSEVSAEFYKHKTEKIVAGLANPHQDFPSKETDYKWAGTRVIF